MGSFKTCNDTVEISPPANCYTMPDMTVCGKDVFRMFKHVRSRNVEGVVWQMFTEEILVTIWNPYFLQENNLWLLATENIREIELVSLKSLQVERKDG